MIPGWGRSSGEGKGNPLQYPYLENPMDRSKPYKLEVWGRFAKSAVVVTSFTNRLLFTCTFQQRGGPEAHISSVLSTQTFPWISSGLCPHTSTSPVFSPRRHFPGSQAVSVPTLPYRYSFSLLLLTANAQEEQLWKAMNSAVFKSLWVNCPSRNVWQTHGYKTRSLQEMSGFGSLQLMVIEIAGVS